MVNSKVEFSFGMPISGGYFYNRSEEVEKLVSRIEKIKKGIRNDIAVIGPRRVGKSSLLIRIAEALGAKGIKTIDIDCEGLTIQIFLKEYGNALISEEVHEKELKQKFKEAVRHGVSSTISILSELLGRIKAIEIKSPLVDFISLRIELEKTAEEELKGEKLYDFFMKTITLPEKLGRKYVIFLDEFQETADYKIFESGDFHTLLRRSIQNQKNVCYVYSGSSIGMMEYIFSDQVSPLAGNADIMRIGPFDERNSKDFIRKGLAANGKSAEESTLDLVFERTGGFPAYLNWIGLRMLDKKEKNITGKDMEAITAEMFSPGSAVYQSISKQLSRLGAKTRRVLTIISMNTTKPGDIARESGAANIYVYIRRLQNYGLLKKEKDGFHLLDPVMAEILRSGFKV